MFFLEAMPMLPLLTIVYFLPYSSKRTKVIAAVEAALTNEGGTAPLAAAGEGTALISTTSASDNNKSRTMSNSSGRSNNDSNSRTPSAPGSAVKAKKHFGDKKKTKSEAEEELLAGIDDDEEETSAGGSLSANAVHSHTHSRRGQSLSEKEQPLTIHSRVHYPHHNPPTAEEVMREAKEELMVEALATGDASAAKDTVPATTPQTASFWAEFKSLICNPIYQAVVLGYAGFTAVVAGVGTFAPTFVVGLGLISDKATASTVAGGVVAVSGIIGTTVGGKLLDWGQLKAKRALDAAKAKVAAAELAVAARAPVESGGFYSPTGTSKKVPVPPAIHRSVSKLLGLSNPGSRSSSASSLQPPPGLLTAGTAGSINGGGAASAGAVGGYQPPSADGVPLIPSSALAAVVVSGSTDDEDDIVELAPPSSSSALGADGNPATTTAEEDEEEESTSPEILDLKLHVTLSQATILSAAGSLFMVAAVFATMWGLGAFIAILTVGTILLMGTTSGVNLAMMASVNPEARSFAVGLGTLMLHALGDVPAQPLIGDLAATLAPCRDSACDDRDPAGLRDTLLATTSWLAWPVALWAAAWVLVSRRSAQRRISGFYDEWNAAAARKREENAAARSRAASEALRRLMEAEAQAANGGAIVSVNPLPAAVAVAAASGVEAAGAAAGGSSRMSMSAGSMSGGIKSSPSEPGLELRGRQ